MTKQTLINYSCVGEKFDLFLCKIEYFNGFNGYVMIKSDIKTILDNKYSFKNIETIEFDQNSQLKTIGKKSFYYSNINKIAIPPSVETIGKKAFSHCDNLKKVDFLEKSKLTIFPSKIFKDSNKKSLYIPSKIIELKKYWCKNTKYLDNISVSPDNKKFTYYQNSFIIEDVGNYKNIVFTPRNIKFAFIPSNIRHISQCAFQNCRNLTKIDFCNNSNLLSIESHAFEGCPIEEVIIPQTVVIIDDKVFYNCKKLKTVIFHDDSNLNIIGKKAFFNNKSLQYFSVPTNVVKIGEKAFFNNKSLQYFSVTKKNEFLVSK